MKLDATIAGILDKARGGMEIGPQEALDLMRVPLQSPEMYALCSVANELSRDRFANQGEVYAQIGLDNAPCPGDCEFCAFGESHAVADQTLEYSIEDVVQAARTAEAQGANGVYLMTTARYRFDHFLEVGRAVRAAVSAQMPLVANIGDFNDLRAQELVEAGFSAVYHAVRLNEGKGTRWTVAQRVRSAQAARKAGLALHFCIEPVGPEHSVEEQVALMFLGKRLGAAFSGAMRRVNFSGSPMTRYGEVSWWYLARTVAVSRLVMGDAALGHCTHEPNLPALLAGGNLLWAEVGTNPRDEMAATEANRGWSVERCQAVLRDADWEVRTGPALSAGTEARALPWEALPLDAEMTV